MKIRKLLSIVGLLAATSASVSGPTNTATTAYGPDVVHLDGLRNIEFGDTEQELAQRGLLTPSVASCGPSLAGMATVGPVFAGDRLVLLWADPSMRTPEGVTSGTSVSEVQAAYPASTPLTAPRGTYRFDGLLVSEGDRSYLFLHDGQTVRKTVAGYTDYARRLFDEGFGTC
ncbi:hypothetical protein GCM10027290_36340 [Micromonospora sonneratiae]|uniref:Uncharacterized protein n=1 Tax=Micromonospora sonneratiae TaxID=1184706 RepID=A0ABW3YF56_9ACTN